MSQSIRRVDWWTYNPCQRPCSSPAPVGPFVTPHPTAPFLPPDQQIVAQRWAAEGQHLDGLGGLGAFYPNFVGEGWGPGGFATDQCSTDLQCRYAMEQIGRWGVPRVPRIPPPEYGVQMGFSPQQVYAMQQRSGIGQPQAKIQQAARDQAALDAARNLGQIGADGALQQKRAWEKQHNAQRLAHDSGVDQRDPGWGDWVQQQAGAQWAPQGGVQARPPSSGSPFAFANRLVDPAKKKDPVGVAITLLLFYLFYAGNKAKSA